MAVMFTNDSGPSASLPNNESLLHNNGNNFAGPITFNQIVIHDQTVCNTR